MSLNLSYLDFKMLDGKSKSIFVNNRFVGKFPIDLNRFYEISFTRGIKTKKNKIKVNKIKIFAKLVSLSAAIKNDVCTHRYIFREIDQNITPKKSLVSYIKVKLY